MSSSPKSLSRAAFAFYLGILISSIGSGTFYNSLMAFLLATGQDLGTAARVLGFSRIIPALANLLIGDLADHISARKMIISTELFGALCSVGLLLSWHYGPSIEGITVFATGHAVALGVQAAAKAKLSKTLSTADYASNAKHAILLNISMYGTTALAGLLGWAAVSYLSFEWVVLFDAVTFTVNGILLLLLPLEAPRSTEKMTLNVLQKFKNLFQTHRRAATYDILLAVVMAGTNVFIARLTAPGGALIPIFIAEFGVAVWIGAWLERKPFIHARHTSIWVGLGLTYLVLGFAQGQPWPLLLCLSAVKDTQYWILFHRFSAKLRHAGDTRLMSSIFSAKTAATIGILCVGEITLGSIAGMVSLREETAVRCGLAVLVGLFTLTRRGRLDQEGAQPG